MPVRAKDLKHRPVIIEAASQGASPDEGVRQLRGTSVNPVDDVEHALVAAGTGVPTSGLILG